MNGTLSLNGQWGLFYNDDFPHFLTAETIPGRHGYTANVPEPVHQTLMDAGVLDDPRVGLNSLRARWVEELYWSYRRTFATPEGLGDAVAWLVFDRLEMNAVIYLNGQELGRHANAHRPARFNVAGKLRTDRENTVVVLIEAGLFDVAEKSAIDYRDTPQVRLTKIHWHRRGQWQRAWDWQQRLLNVGILGDVRLEWHTAPLIEQAQVYSMVSDDLSRATFHGRVNVQTPSAEPLPAVLTIREGRTGKTAHVHTTLQPGVSLHAVTLTVEDPELWWPVGHGEQTRYEVTLTLEAGGESQSVTRQTGVRRVEIDQSPHSVEGKHFILKINNRPIFCKGGNWVPADMLYSTVTPERYRELVDLALGANFNMLRIWGGGIFADPALLDYCDETGVLVWHDLLFACSKYPGDQPDFALEVNNEVTWAVREMAHHPSLVVWCGNNEIEEGDWHWGWQNQALVTPHYALFHRDFPRILAHEDPSKFYWPSSPFSPDSKSPRDPTVGDQHPWRVSLQVPGGADWWEYRKMVDRFPNEGGVLGASSPATLRQFLPENERYLLSPSWEHHDNPFAVNDTRPGNLGHCYQTVQLWTGLEPFDLDWERYAFVSALLQAEGISEYIFNFRRRMFSSASAIFWMYNDSWPVTHGWTIVDYYRRKKLSYHPTRRAFQPVTVIVAEDNGIIRPFVINDTPEEWRGMLCFGTFKATRLHEYAGFGVEVPPFTVQTISDQYVRRSEEIGPEFGAFANLYRDPTESSDTTPIAQHRYFKSRFHELGLVKKPRIQTVLENGRLTLYSDVFCWGVCLDVNGERLLDDNCFDLLPGTPYSLPWDESRLGKPKIVRLGNRDALP